MAASIILGMHRSGTSLVSSIIHRMGIPMGGPLQDPDEFNPYGYWEDVGFKELNKAILDDCEGDWDDFITRKQVFAAMPPFVERMTVLVEERGGTVPGKKWGFKDPRTCITCWAWDTVLPNAKYIVVSRSKEAVIKSLLRTGREGSWNKLYRHYWNHINSFADLHPNNGFYYIAYEDLMHEDYRIPAVMGLAQFLGVPGKARDGLKMIRQKAEN